MSRAIGLDVHRDFCVVALCERGRARVAGRVETSPEQLELFGESLAATDRVVLEATGNAWAIARVLEGHVAEVVLAHPKRVRAIAEAKVKTDKVDARGYRRCGLALRARPPRRQPRGTSPRARQCDHPLRSAHR